MARTETDPIRKYMVEEAQHQYRDYYETDAEEQEFFEFMDNMPARDRIRFAEIFEDFTIDKRDPKDFVSIAKREYNPELSVFSNLYLDLVDFKDRIRPLAKDMTMWDASREYQRTSPSEILEQVQEQEPQIEAEETAEPAAEEIAEEEHQPELEEGQEEKPEEKE